uniref:Uncharacterized protein n=1 Tax=uncultured organism MedDCM-OCT-S09-C568 TaxID=743651 RepID=D6PJE5_9ZZZZ|nr:hypothetical protein [uncultured organism MedDCM-OCT-S09-C568]
MADCAKRSQEAWRRGGPYNKKVAHDLKLQKEKNRDAMERENELAVGEILRLNGAKDWNRGCQCSDFKDA